MTIPADIMKAARAVLTAPKHATRPHTELLLRIAVAIEDERRRCAAIANRWKSSAYIERVIRSGEQP